MNKFNIDVIFSAPVQYAPKYLCDHTRPTTSASSLRSSRRHDLFLISIGPSLWNRLPHPFRSSILSATDSLSLSRLKSYLFPGAEMHYQMKRYIQYNTIHPSNVPWVHHPLVSNAHLTFIFHVSVLCFPFQNVYFLVTPFPYIVQPFSFWSSFLFLPSHRTPLTLPVCYLPFYRCAQLSLFPFLDSLRIHQYNTSKIS